MTSPTNATPVMENPSLAMSSSLPNSPQLSGSPYPSPRVHEYAVTSASDIKRVRPGVFSVGRNDFGDNISRTASSPIDLRLARNISDISARSKSEGREHARNPHSPSVTSRSSYSPPTEDDSDFEMDEQSTLNRTFNHPEEKREEGRGKTSEWDGLEMEMEM